MNFTALQDKVECLGSPQVVVEGESAITPTITFWTTVSTTSATETAMRGTSDLSSTVLSGSLSASSNVLTCKAIASEIGGYTYRYILKVLVGTEYVQRYFDRVVLRKEGPRSSFV